MPTPLLALLAFVAWTLLIVVAGIGAVRVSKVLRGEAKPNAFPANVPHGSERYQRTLRAHANCVENLPVFASVVLIGEVVGFRSGAFDTLSVVYVAARMAQTIAHIASGRSRIINIRFVFFLVQILCVISMGALLLTR